MNSASHLFFAFTPLSLRNIDHQNDAMTGTLTNRVSRVGSVLASKGGSKLVPLRQPHNGSPNPYRTAFNSDGDDTTVKSNTGLPPPYVLPCFRFRRKKASLLVVIGLTAMLMSLCSLFIAYRTMGTSSDGRYFLPSAKEWGADRERRKKARRERRDQSPDSIERETKGVKYTEYESRLLNFLFSLRAAGVNSSILPLNDNEPLGQDMGKYTNLGCSVWNELNSNPKITEYNRDQVRQLWSSYLPTILEASRHADDAAYVHKNWTATLLESLSTYSILRDTPNELNYEAVSTKDIERITGIIVRRLLGILQNGGEYSANLPPPLKIAVFGGSTVEGRGCHRANVKMPHGSIMTNPAFCAFPYRLEQFINAILLPPAVLAQLRRTLGGPLGPGGTTSGEDFRLVAVINLGEEGTGSEYSSAIVLNRMYPHFSIDQSGTATGYGGGPPDLVIDAYGIDAYGSETTEMTNIYDAVGKLLSRIPRRCLKENSKPPPVIVQVALEDDASTSTSIVVGDAIDDVEEGETSLPNILDPKRIDNEAGTFGMAGHMAMAWTLAFNLASLAIDHCGISGHLSRPQKPVRRMNNAASADCDSGIDPPCIFSFLAGPKGNAPRPSAIASSLIPFVVENTGWLPESDMTSGFARKTGLVGTGEGATMTLLFRNITRPVRRLDVVTLRSTSQAWKDGVVQFALVTGGDFSHGKAAAEASTKIATESSFTISADLIVDGWNGEEDKHVSYHFGLDLIEGENSGHVGSDVLLRMSLTKGDRFKILGLMLCE